MLSSQLGAWPATCLCSLARENLNAHIYPYLDRHWPWSGKQWTSGSYSRPCCSCHCCHCQWVYWDFGPANLYLIWAKLICQGQPTIPEKQSFVDCQQELLEELLQHFEIGASWQAHNSCMSFSLRTFVFFFCMAWFEKTCWGWWCQDLRLCHFWMMSWLMHAESSLSSSSCCVDRSCVSAARMTIGLRLPDWSWGLEFWVIRH